MAASVEQLIAKYIELRDREAEISKRHEEALQAEVAPVKEAKATIENYLLHLMHQMGVSQLKAAGVGTAFKKDIVSCQMQDAKEFKDFVFEPVLKAVLDYFQNSGWAVRDVDYESVRNVLRDMPRWDMVDFRAGKTGIKEYIENENQPVPGVAVNTMASVSIRRA